MGCVKLPTYRHKFPKKGGHNFFSAVHISLRGSVPDCELKLENWGHSQYEFPCTPRPDSDKWNWSMFTHIARADTACNVQFVKWNILVIENISYSLTCPPLEPKKLFHQRNRTTREGEHGFWMFWLFQSNRLMSHRGLCQLCPEGRRTHDAPYQQPRKKKKKKERPFPLSDSTDALRRPVNDFF